MSVETSSGAKGSLITYRVTGDLEIQHQFAKAGSKIRAEVGKALAKHTLATLQRARAGAPTRRTSEGIQAYGYGFQNNWNEHGSGSGIPQYMIDAIEDAIGINNSADSAAGGRLSSIIANTYYLGRFREAGFDGSVDVRAHTRRAKGRKSWARPKHIAKLIRGYKETYGNHHWRRGARKEVGTMFGERKLRLLFNRKGGQVAVNFARRHHRVARVAFMESAYAATEPGFESAMTAAVAEGMKP